MITSERNSLLTTSSSSSTISEMWERRDNETGWQDLHKKIVNYRQNNKITIKSFLTLCGLPNASYYRQLCCFHGNIFHPSNKRESKGRVFLDGITNFFQQFENGVLVASLETTSDLENELDDFQMDHFEQLHKISIRELHYKKQENKIVVSCLANADEVEMKNFLNQTFQLDGLDLEFFRIELLYSPPPPYTVAKPVANAFEVGTITHVTVTVS